MNTYPRRAGLAGLLAALIGLSSAGCQSQMDADSAGTGPPGSISDINRKLGGSKPTSGSTGTSTAPAQTILLVMHDAEGKPLYAEVRGSCGDPAKDRRAVDYVLNNRRFPKGAPNTVTVTVDPKRLPKSPAPR
jgi:hypothetical protein